MRRLRAEGRELRQQREIESAGMLGVQCKTISEWNFYVESLLPECRQYRAQSAEACRRMIVDAQERRDEIDIAQWTSRLERMEGPITWVTLAMFAKRINRRPKKPPRGLTPASYTAGLPTTAP
jgi:hypothetical protein